MNSIIVRSAALLGLMVVAGGASWVLNVPLGVGVIASLIAFVVAIVATVKKSTSPPLFMLYAGLQGVAIGTISHMYESAYTGIVLQAVLGVIMVFAAMLFLYTTRIIKVTNKFAKIVLAAGLGYILLSLANFVTGLFIPGGFGLRDGGTLSILVSIGAVVIGALFYALDFDQAERLVASGAPEKESWRVAFGLTLTTVWIYLEILRLLSYFRN